MLKSVFVDYTGTLLQEGGTDVEEMLMRCYHNSEIESPQAMLRYWWGMVKEYELASYKETYLTEDEIVDKMLERCVEEIQLKDNLEELHKLCQSFWVHAPIFDDVKEFFEKCLLPIYVISNNGIPYIEEAMKVNELHPAGIVCGDMVKAYKPHSELFEKALEVSGCKNSEVIHIGDSFASDVKGAQSVGISAILMDRKGNTKESGVTVVKSLLEVIPIVNGK